MMSRIKSLVPWVVVLTIFVSGAAMADCYIDGDITANATNDPMGPDWAYTMVINWDTGVPQALSHANLLLDVVGSLCSCGDFHDALSFDPIIGTSDGEPGGCEVEYEGFIECSGDPSIPGVDGFLLKFEPVMGECEPGNTGQAVFVFYSDLAPVPVDEDILSVVDKHGQSSCFGNLTGEFPGMACDPVADSVENWGSLKGTYR